MNFINLFNLTCILTSFAILFVLLPQKLFPCNPDINFVDKVLSNVVYGLLVVFLGCNFLPRVQLFNLITLISCFFFWPFFNWLLVNNKQALELIKLSLLNKYIKFLDILESDNFKERILNYWFNKKQLFLVSINKINQLEPIFIIGTVFFTATFSFTLLLNFIPAFEETRFPFSESYQTLFKSWQILLSQIDNKKIILFPAIIASISTVASIDPLQTVRFFPSILVCLFIILFGITTWKISKSKGVGLVSIYLLGTNIFYWPEVLIVNNTPKNLLENLQQIIQKMLGEPLIGGEQILALAFLFLVINFWNELINEKTNFNRNLVNILICLLFLGASAPILLLPAVTTMFALMILPSGALLVLSGSLSLIVFFFETKEISKSPNLDFFLLIALVLFCAAFCQFVIYLIKFLINQYAEPTIVALIVALTIMFLPKPFNFQYLEYDISIRKALEITQIFPKKQWLIIAPVEEFSVSYGFGWYEDLASFVDKYQDKVKSPSFQFSFSLDTFIFVEKRPFSYFQEEPKEVSFSVLRDSSYKNYRSFAGRASLEQQALTLCETYRKLHPETKIYYEDEVLCIYLIQK